MSQPNKNSPFLMCHGEEDAMVHYKFGKKSYESLVGLGLKGNFLSYPGRVKNELV